MDINKTFRNFRHVISRCHKKEPSPAEQNLLHLILTGGCLASFQLLQIPPADLHVPLVLIQALSELFRIHLTTACAPTGTVAVSLHTCRGNLCLLRLGGGARTTTSKEATDCVANSGTHCDTSSSRCHLTKKSGSARLRCCHRDLRLACWHGRLSHCAGRSDLRLRRCHWWCRSCRSWTARGRSTSLTSHS